MIFFKCVCVCVCLMVLWWFPRRFYGWFSLNRLVVF